MRGSRKRKVQPIPTVLAVGAQSFNNFDVQTLAVGARPPANWRPYRDHSANAPSPFNQAIPPEAWVHANSAAWITQMNGRGTVGGGAGLVARPLGNVGGMYLDYFHPVYFAKTGDPSYTAICDITSFEVHNKAFIMPAAAKPAGTVAFGGVRGDQDQHIGVVSPSGVETSIYQAANPSGTGGNLACYGGGSDFIDGDGLGSGATAAYFGLSAGQVRYEELSGAGEIEHALFGVTPLVWQTVSPATGNASQGTSADMPLGSRLRLKRTIAEINASTHPTWAKKLQRALRNYGCLIGDTGGSSSLGFQFESGMVYRSFNGNATEPWSSYAGVTGVTSTVDTGRTIYIFELRNYVAPTDFEVMDHRGFV